MALHKYTYTQTPSTPTLSFYLEKMFVYTFLWGGVVIIFRVYLDSVTLAPCKIAKTLTKDNKKSVHYVQIKNI